MASKDYATVCMAVRLFQKRAKIDKKARRLLTQSQQMLYVPSFAKASEDA